MASGFAGVPRTSGSNPTQDALQENIEVLTGQRGSGLNRALLYSDLVNLNSLQRTALLNAYRTGNGPKTAGGLPVNSIGIEKPSRPTNVTAQGGFTFIALTWDEPSYRGHAYAEIYRSETDNYSEAVRIATEITNIFSDSVAMGSTYYYWVRFVNQADIQGPIQSTSGIEAETQNSAEQILGAIGGQIEASHLGAFLSADIALIPAIKTSVDQLNITVPEIESNIPALNEAVFGEDGVIASIRETSELAVARSEEISSNSESMARRLIDAALINDLNWDDNTVTLVSIQSELNGVKATIETEFYTRTEANLAIAAAAETIEAQIEATGLSLSGDIANTYYTIASADEAIAASASELRALIEDPNGDSIGATLTTDYYTQAEADSAIAAAGDTLKASIEDPNGSSVGATLFTNYLTTSDVNQAISEANTTLKSQIEDPSGNSVGATLFTGYYTKTATDSAISNATNVLKSQIEDPEGGSIGAMLVQDYQTKADADQSLAHSVQTLSSSMEPSVVAMLQGLVNTDVEVDRQRVITATLEQGQKTLTTETEALSEAIINLEAVFNDSNASVTVLRESVANEISATAQEFKKLQAEISGVSAELYQNYYTVADADSAIVQAVTSLKSQIEDPNGNSLGATLDTAYYTKTAADVAISAATSALKSAIEDPNGTSLGATLETSYYTKTAADAAISSAASVLKSQIEDPEGNSIGGTLATNYYTSAQADGVISEQLTLLRSAIEDPAGTSIGATINTDYSTTADMNSAISTAVTQLQSAIEDPNGSSIAADLQQNYMTSTEANAAISTAVTTLQSTIEDADGNSVGATLQTLAETVATNDEKWAMWAVKTTVADVTSSFGLVNDGVDPIFAIKGAKFSVITSQDPDVLTPIFSVVDNKTVMTSALIDQAFIKSLVTDDLLSDRVLVSSVLQTPSINYDNGTRSGNFSIDPAGNMVAKSAELHEVTIKDVDGNVVMSSSGVIPSTKVSGLGTLAGLNSVSTAQVDGLGALATIDTLSYSALSGLPVLGDLASQNSVTVSEVSDFNTGVTTIIDTAFVKSLLAGELLAAKIYGNNIEGDIYNIKTYSIADKSNVTASEHTILTIGVAGLPSNVSYDRVVRIEDLVVTFSDNAGSAKSGTVTFRYYFDGTLKLTQSVTVYVSAFQSGTIVTYGSGKGTLPRAYIDAASNNTLKNVVVKMTVPSSLAGLDVSFARETASYQSSTFEVALFKEEQSLS